MLLCLFSVVLCFPILFAVSFSANENDVTPIPEVGIKNVTAHYCPFPCTVGNQTLCYPPPCPPPPCYDPAKYQPTDCCEYCPNGPDCSAPDGGIVKFKEWRMVDGKNCTCDRFMQPATCV